MRRIWSAKTSKPGEDRRRTSLPHDLRPGEQEAKGERAHAAGDQRQPGPQPAFLQVLLGEGEHADQAIGDADERDRHPTTEHDDDMRGERVQQPPAEEAAALVEREQEPEGHPHPGEHGAGQDVPGDRIAMRRAADRRGNDPDVEREGPAEQRAPDGEPRKPFP